MAFFDAPDFQLTREPQTRARKLRFLPALLLATLLGAGALNFVSSPVAAAPPVVPLTGPTGIVAPNSRTGMVYGIALAPDGLTLAAGDDASNIKLWDTQTGTLRQVLAEHQGTVHAVAFSDDGATLVSGSTLYHNKEGYLTGGEVKVWDAKTGELRRSLAWPDYYVRNVALSGDGKTMAIGGGRSLGNKFNTDVELRDVQTGQLLHRLTQRADAQYEIAALVFSPDGKWVVTSLRDGLRIWNAKTGKLQNHLPHQGGLLAQPITISPDSKRVATSYENVVEIIDLATGQPASKVQVPAQMIGLGLDTLDFLSDTQLIGKSAFALYEWDLNPNGTRKILRGYNLGEAVIARDGQSMAGKGGNDLFLQKIDWSAAKIVSD